MDNQEQNDPVWDLLKKVSYKTPGPFFARNTVREVRLMEENQLSVGARLLSFFGNPSVQACGAVAASIAIALLVFFPGSGESPTTSLANSVEVAEVAAAFDPASEIEEIEYLGQLMAVTDPGKLSDDVLADLFF
tara:strand:+ start:52 stop:453 length:402 start_codon:yes stop_codon:yes gene_type:complete